MGDRKNLRTPSSPELNRDNYEHPMPERMTERVLGMVQVALLRGSEVQAITAIRRAFAEWADEANNRSPTPHPDDSEHLSSILAEQRLINKLEDRGIVTAGQFRAYVCGLVQSDPDMPNVGHAYAKAMLEQIGFPANRK